MDKYPVPANAFYDPNFLPISTSSSQFLRVDKDSYLYVHPMSPPDDSGSCTASTTSGYVTVSETQYSNLDKITLATDETLDIRGFHSFCTTQSQVELVAKTATSLEYLLNGGVAESGPTWDFRAPVAIRYTATEATDIILRAKGLRLNRSGSGTGRIFAHIV